MREIKFRAWDGAAMYHTRDGWSEDADVFGQVWEELNRFGYKVMQYTGLKDKNGVEIYEGDILKPLIGNPPGWYDLWVVGHSDCRFTMTPYHADHGGLQERGIPLKPFNPNEKGYEKIGNIHENPELLE